MQSENSMTSGRNISILIVDDDASLLRALERVLSDQGCKVTCANWVAEAMEQLDDPQKGFDLIITDLHMPFVRGASILRMIAQRLDSVMAQPASATDGKPRVQGIHPTVSKVPVIVLTAYGSQDVRDECSHLGVAAFLEKPLDTQQLLAAIESALALQKSVATDSN